MFDFIQPPRAVEGVIPDGGPSKLRGRGKAGTIDIGCYEAVRSREVVFAFGAGDLARGCINVQLLVLSCVRLAMVRAGCSVGENLGVEGLEIRFAFPCGAKDASPVGFT